MIARPINAMVITDTQEVLGIVDTTTGETIRCLKGRYSAGEIAKLAERTDDSGLPAPHCRIVEPADPEFVRAMKDRLIEEARKAGIVGPVRFAKGTWYVVIED
jgi:hypothetical protein